MTVSQRIGVLDAGNVRMNDDVAGLHVLGEDAKPRVHAEKPSLWREEKVVFESLVGETQHVPGYSG